MQQLIITEMKTNRAKKPAPLCTAATLNFNLPMNRECLKNNELDIASYKNINAITEISRYFNFLADPKDNIQNVEVYNCFALRLSLFLIDLIRKDACATHARGYSKNHFFRRCIEKASGEDFAREINDNELLAIYIKQCLHLLKICGIIKKSAINSFVVTDHSESITGLYYKLLNAFWVEADWAAIFPSDTESARELKISKNILKDLLLRNSGRARLDKIANEFFEMTGFSRRDDLVMISFIDFYFFTWLKHFNLISYMEDSPYAPVSISVTESGKKILKLI